ncbi:MAG: 3-hydroxyacyl-CoA dehydrogenase NAD-binding domain-containing protein [Bacteroidota bacterium]|nr:3-hydroxyacyl-CoA dehydrogenase NAD-binding domain-containing protein [Bacteroidota bacterium]
MKTIGVIGAGSMGSGIAQIAATNECKVLLFDNNPKALLKALEKLEKILNRLVQKNKINQLQLEKIISRISTVENIVELSSCDLVIEAIIEDIDVKKNIFSELDVICPKSTILATNTSSLSVTSIASSCKFPERVIGIHFFNPAPIMPLVEIIPCIQGTDQTLQISKKLIDSWGKVAVIAKDTPGFIVNRIARPFYGEALRIYEEGIANFETIDYAMTEIGGFRMGPFTLMDFIGNDVNYAVTESVFKSFYFDPRYKPSFTQKRHAEAGWFGKKSNRGYYDYSSEELRVVSKDRAVLVSICNRILFMLINEAADALFLNIATKEDIDLAMTKGVNYPKGLLKWADEIGIEKCVNSLDLLYNEYKEDRYRCSPLLRRMVNSKSKFYS